MSSRLPLPVSAAVAAALWLGGCGDSGGGPEAGANAYQPANPSSNAAARELLPTEAELEAEAARITPENADAEFDKLRAEIEDS